MIKLKHGNQTRLRNLVAFVFVEEDEDEGHDDDDGEQDEHVEQRLPRLRAAAVRILSERSVNAGTRHNSSINIRILPILENYRNAHQTLTNTRRARCRRRRI